MTPARKRSGLLAGTALTILFLVLAARGWGKWGDILIDFGGELYIPWRLSQGAALYRDIAFLKGPLSSYFMAGVFSLFGASVLTFTLTNLSIAALTAFFIHRFFHRACGRFAAFFAVAVFLVFFVFAHFFAVGVFNWIAPYSEDLVAGAALSVGLLVSLQGVVFQRKAWKFALSGFLFGLVLLTKVEVMAAASFSVAAFFLLDWAVGDAPRKTKLREFFLFALAALIPVAVAFGLLSFKMGAGPAASALAFTIEAAMDPEVSRNLFYKSSLGLVDPWGNLGAMGLGLLRVAVSAAILLGAGVLAGRSRGYGRGLLAALAGLLGIGALGLVFGEPLPALIQPRALTLLCLASSAGLLTVLLARGRGGGPDPRTASLALWAVFSLLLLAKMFLLPRVAQLGFVLAMPAALLLVAGFASGLPLLAERLGGSGRIVRILVAALLVADLGFGAFLTNVALRRKTASVGEGRNRMMAYAETRGLRVTGRAMEEILNQVRDQVEPGETLLALPEGVMVNFLTKRVNPSRFINFMPTELIVFGEGAILEDIRDKSPDWVLVIPKPSQDFGVGLFGRDTENGRAIMGFVREKYAPVWEMPRPGLPLEEYTIRLYRRKAGPLR